MNVITLRSTDRLNPSDQVLALGFFDGMHSAHTALLKQTVQLARQHHFSAAMMTFSTHVLSFLKKEPFFHLTSLNDKVRIADQLGFDTVYVLEVEPSLVGMDALQFIEQFLNAMKIIVVGFDFTYGRRGAGNVSLLKQQTRFETHVIEEQVFYRHKIGSTRIREAVRQGRVEHAAHLLGRPYRILGEVIKGKGRGTNLGFPTANIDYHHYLLPKAGVYLASVWVEEHHHFALVNVGDNPTFHDIDTTIEAYLLDFHGNLYGKEMAIDFLRFERKEIEYTNIDDLIEQMKEDERIARAFLEKR
jgi:riboflavin kinase / FMN adenylyltransferase